MPKPHVELLSEGLCRNGKIIRDIILEEKFAQHYEGQKVLVSYKPVGSLPQKARLFAYLFGPLLSTLSNALEHAGFEGNKMEFYEAMKRRFSAYPWINPITKQEEIRTLDFSSDSTTSAQLGKFVNDIILFMEMELDTEAPNSDEYKVQKRLGPTKKTFG